MDKCNVKPKIVVTLSSPKHEWEDAISSLKENRDYIDMIEYRADLCGELTVEEYIEDVLFIKQHMDDIDVIFTYRTEGEGGRGQLEPNAYYNLCRTVIERECADVIDIEVLLYEELMDALIQSARDHQMEVLLSHHEFQHTPSTEEIKALYSRMNQLGADYCKVAVMPEDGKDVLKLLLAVYESKQYCDKQIVGIAMGEQGKLSRIAGGAFGSSLTYGHIGEASAPGQLHVKQLKNLMEIYQ